MDTRPLASFVTWPQAQDFLNVIASNVTVVEFVEGWAAHPEWMPPRAQNPQAAPMTDADLDGVLAISGLPGEVQEQVRAEARDDALGARAAVHDALVVEGLMRSTWSTKEAAEKLDRDPTSITRGIKSSRYYGIKVSGALRLPTWQFMEETHDDDEPGEDAVPATRYVPLPNLQEVVTAISPSLHPSVVEGFMRTPQGDLKGQTPRDWLASGGRAADVAELVAGLRYS